MEDVFQVLINQKRQRAGLLAVINGVLMTTEDEDTKRTIAVVVDKIFKDHPVEDDIEKITKGQIQEYLAEEEEDPLHELLRNMFNQK